MLLQLLLQVYYGQDDDINTLPILFACVVAYGAYKLIKSAIDEPSRQAILDHENKKVAERDAKTKAIIEQNDLSNKSPSLDVIADFDEAKKKAEVTAKMSALFAPKRSNVEQKEQSESNPSTDTLVGTDEKKINADAMANVFAKTAGAFGVNPKAAIEDVADKKSETTDSNNESESLDIKIPLYPHGLLPHPRWAPWMSVKKEQQSEGFEAEDEISA